MNKIKKYITRQSIFPLNTHYPNLTILYKKPLILQIPNFLSRQECDILIKLINNNESLFLPSRSKHNRRQSRELRFSFSHFPNTIKQKLTQLFLIDTSHQISFLETPKLTKYTESDFFKTHQDGVTKSNYHTPHRYCNVPFSNRMCTLLIYLNTLDSIQGGETYFNDLKLSIKPQKGKAILFFPCYYTNHPTKPGKLNFHTRHESKPIKTPCYKYVYQQWIWNGPYIQTQDINSKDIQHGIKIADVIKL